MCTHWPSVALHSTVGIGWGYFLMPYSCLTSGVRTACPLHHLCSGTPSIPPADNPSKENRAPRLHDADLIPLLRLQAATPHRCWTFLPLKSIFPPSRDEGKKGISIKIKEAIVPSVSDLSASSLSVLDLTLTSPDIETVVSKCSANSWEVCLRARKLWQ